MGVYEIVGRMANGKAALRQLLGPKPVTLSHFRTVPAVGSAVRLDLPNFGVSGKEETFNSGHFDRLSDRSPGHQSGNAQGTEQDRAPTKHGQKQVGNPLSKQIRIISSSSTTPSATEVMMTLPIKWKS